MNESPASSKARSTLEALVRESKVPGIQYLVLSSDRTHFEFAGGWSDIRARRPMDFTTTMMAYSMSKTITAAAVLQLVEKQKLKLDDPIDRYSGWHPYGPGITIRQLLTHTSGIPNPIPLSWVHSPAEHDRFDERAELLAVLKKHSKLAYEPGTKFQYSNIGYWLLGPIIEAVSGQPFTEFVKRSLLTPLNIPPEELGYRIPEHGVHAKGYLEKYSLMNLLKRFVISARWIGRYENRWLHIQDHYLNGPAFGGLVGSARGFGKFLQDQLRHPLPKLFDVPQRTTQGVEIPMSLGWHTTAVAGQTCFYKEGGGGGFHCLMRVYPASGIASVAMTNATMFDVRRLMDAIDIGFRS